MKDFITTFFAFLLFSASAFAQQKEDPYQKKYEWRIRQEVLYGVYIPKDVNEAILVLNKLTDTESKAKFKNMSEEEAVTKLFFSLGRWISYNWSFHDGSRLAVVLQKMGIYRPDDMSRFIMILFHRSLNKRPLEIKALLKIFHEKAELERNERLNKGTIIHEETRQKPKPEEGKNGGH
ncbi:MAG: DUF6794 domain-containing protein [Bacteroidota bacterium]